MLLCTMLVPWAQQHVGSVIYPQILWAFVGAVNPQSLDAMLDSIEAEAPKGFLGHRRVRYPSMSSLPQA